MFDLQTSVNRRQLEEVAVQDLLTTKEEVYQLAKVCRDYTDEKESLVANLVMFAAYHLRKEEIARSMETNQKFANRGKN